MERYADVDLYGVLRLTAEATLVNAAGEVLRDQAARARYDALRAARRSRPGASQGTPAEDRRRRELAEHLAAARQELPTTQVHLAATEASQLPGRRRCGSRGRLFG